MSLKNCMKKICFTGLYNFFSLFPLKNKVVACNAGWKTYSDNSKYIIEELHKLDENVDLVWVVNRGSNYELPSYVRGVKRNNYIKCIYEYSTAKVWIDTHTIEIYQKKRRGQLFIETWHGGLGIKSAGDGMKSREEINRRLPRYIHTSENADIFISNSNFITDVYRKAFHYKGTIWKCGYPRSDILFTDAKNIKKKIYNIYNISDKTKILLYAPTFREYNIDEKTYYLDTERIKQALKEKWGCDWKILVRWHPSTLGQLSSRNTFDKNVIDVTKYPDMQELIIASDAFISDFSGGIFDAAIRKIPCFMYARDYERYLKERGVYFEKDQLPFLFADTNEDLIDNILHYDKSRYEEEWDEFIKSVGLFESGHAAKDISIVILEFLMNGNNNVVNNIRSE